MQKIYLDYNIILELSKQSNLLKKVLELKKKNKFYSLDTYIIRGKKRLPPHKQLVIRRFIILFFLPIFVYLSVDVYHISVDRR